MSEFTLGESMGGQTKVDKWNEKTIFRGTGAEIAAASTNVKVMICTSTGSGYTANHVYFRKADNSIVDIGVVDQAETISGLYTFDRGASQAPFA
ncbi:MAG: hypothetical protein HYU02_07805, partial [Thaumarchaeota archaeon]|nr:hypothetical protein [Nitrososphaerota archaeon]